MKITKIYKVFMIFSLLALSFCFLCACADKSEDDSQDLNVVDGKDGACWYSGEGSPESAYPEAKIGDFYLNTATCDIYKLTDVGWIVIVNIKGDSGNSDTDSEVVQDSGKGDSSAGDSNDSAPWAVGEGSPKNETASDGTLYLDSVTKDVWYKINGFWSVIGNMSGEIKKQNWNDDNVLKILFIGNSFSVDTAEYMYDIAANLGIENVKIGNLYIGGCSLATHLANMKDNLPNYHYYTNFDGTWNTIENHTIKDAVISENWDFISFQQASGDSGIASTYSNLWELIELVEPLCPKAKLVWNMTWAYASKSSHSHFYKYENNQKTMYYAITEAVKNKIVSSDEFYAVSPTGTAIQNVRATVIGDNLTRDGFHLSNLGRYIAGVTFLHSITGVDISTLSYIPEDFASKVYNPDGDMLALSDIGISLTTSEIIEIVKNAVMTAKITPFDSSFPSDSECTVDIDWSNGYYQSNNAEYYHTLIDTTKNLGTAPKYWATQIFTRDTLKEGTVIELKAGYVLRVEGWYNGQKNDNRQAEIQGAVTITVDEAFFTETGVTSNGVSIVFSEIAFNIRAEDNSDISGLSEEELNDIFKIYPPENN